MKISNDTTELLLSRLREPGNCEVCGRHCKKREPVHLFASGLGGSPMNVRINLLSAGSTKQGACKCHTQSHARSYGEYDPVFLDVIARREKADKSDILAVLYLFRRLTKPTLTELVAGLATLETPEQHRLALAQLGQSGYLDSDLITTIRREPGL